MKTYIAYDEETLIPNNICEESLGCIFIAIRSHAYGYLARGRTGLNQIQVVIPRSPNIIIVNTNLLTDNLRNHTVHSWACNKTIVQFHLRSTKYVKFGAEATITRILQD